MAKILIVEDDQTLALSIATALEAYGHKVEMTDNGDDAIDLLNRFGYDLAIIDWGIPGKAGIEVIHTYRAGGGVGNILMLTGKSHIDDKEKGFSTGADDYLTKPFDMRELRARVDALLRRVHAYKEETIVTGDLAVDLTNRIVRLKGHEIALTSTEYAVLEYLIRRPNRFFTVEELLNNIWESGADVTEHAVRQCISRLRKKLAPEETESIIRTSKGLGYRIDLA